MALKRSFQMQGTLDGGLSWFVVLGSFMTQFVVMGIHNVFGLLYLDLLTEFGESKATTGTGAFLNFEPSHRDRQMITQSSLPRKLLELINLQLGGPIKRVHPQIETLEPPCTAFMTRMCRS